MTSIQYPIGPFEPRPGPLSDADRAALIDRIEALPARAAAALAGLDEAQLDTPYREGGWTPRQITHHLADSHLNAFVRVKLAMTEERPTIRPYDQERWAEQPDVIGVPVEASLRILDGLHRRWTALWRALEPSEFARPVLHPEYPGKELDLDFFLQLYGWHGDHHVTQVEQLRARSGW